MNLLKDKNYKIILIIVIAIIGAIGYFVYAKDEFPQIENLNIDNTSTNESNKETKENMKIIVHVSGQVNQEGIVELEQNCRVSDAIEKAGGLKEDADISNINLAEILEDGTKIYIPKKGELEQNTPTDNSNIQGSQTQMSNSSKTYNKSTSSKSTIVNINTASQTELETLPGIGPSTALKIINYRKENGKFKTIDDIKKVSGIGDAKFEKIKSYIKV